MSDTAEVAADPRLQKWRSAWPQALAAWSKYTRLHDPLLCPTRVEAASAGLTGSFAMIRLSDQSIVVDLEAVASLGLDEHAVEILAHEVGHHVLAPATMNDQLRLLARIRRALPTLERHAPMVANLYTDLLINDRLQRQAGLRLADVYRRLQAAQPPQSGTSQVWTLYMGLYEHLWQLPRGSLGGPVTQPLLADAWLGARLIRVYAADWMEAAGRFASLLLPYLVHDEDKQAPAMGYLHDTRDAARGGTPVGGWDVEPAEEEGNIHPSQDPRVTGDPVPADAATQPAAGAGQAREPFEYGELLRSAGLVLSDHEVAVRYYRERALPHLVPFPTRRQSRAPEPQLEGLDPWEAGDPLDALDLFQSAMQSHRMIPGYTTVQRHHGFEPGTDTARVPVDLDLYVDSSGSMPNPQRSMSYLALAGAVVAMSALRAGSSVQVTLWSGKRQFTDTGGFVRNEDHILGVLTGFFGGATAFPIHRLRETYRGRPATARPVHILHISDDGITTMFDRDEQGNDGWEVAAQALANGRAGGTMALNVPRQWDRVAGDRTAGWPVALRRARDEQGWAIHAVEKAEDLLDFARAFARRHYSAGADR